MPDLVLDLLKYVFLAVLYVFVARAVRAGYLELKPAGARRTRAYTGAPPAGPSRPSKKTPRKVAVVEGNARGKSFDLRDELIIGRADRCHVVLDDTYASQTHARIFARNDAVMVEDLGSTNGTYLNRRKLTAPAELHRGDKVKIGKTVLELRR